MYSNNKTRGQAGYSMVELLVAMGTMVIVTGAAFSLIHGSLKFATSTYHMTDAEQGMRTAHEIINRDLTTAGDGLKSIGTIPVPLGFVTNYLTLSPVLISGQPNLSIVTSDDNIAGTTPVLQTNPAVTVMDKMDRLTLLMQDKDFAAVSLAAGKVTFSGTNTNLAITAAYIGRFKVGEIYAIASTQSAAFCVISAISVGTNTLTLSTGDVYGINQSGTTAPVYVV